MTAQFICCRFCAGEYLPGFIELGVNRGGRFTRHCQATGLLLGDLGLHQGRQSPWFVVGYVSETNPSFWQGAGCALG